MQQVVINRCFGGFGLSEQAMREYCKAKGWECHVNKDYGFPIFYKDAAFTQNIDMYRIQRDDPDLVRIVKELGSKANNSLSKLEIIDVPEGVQWGIEEYDGMEWVAEKHRTWPEVP